MAAEDAADDEANEEDDADERRSWRDNICFANGTSSNRGHDHVSHSMQRRSKSCAAHPAARSLRRRICATVSSSRHDERRVFQCGSPCLRNAELIRDNTSLNSLSTSNVCEHDISPTEGLDENRRPSEIVSPGVFRGANRTDT